jgi:FeS assembly protein IscX
MKWTDVQEIALALSDSKPDVDARFVNFVDLRDWVLALQEFDDTQNHCGEKVLEAIQMAWIDEQG